MAEQAGGASGRPRHFSREARGRVGEAKDSSGPRRSSGTVQDALDRMAAGIGERRRAREEARGRGQGDAPEGDEA
jgi:hypothetical protein